MIALQQPRRVRSLTEAPTARGSSRPASQARATDADSAPALLEAPRHRKSAATVWTDESRARWRRLLDTPIEFVANAWFETREAKALLAEGAAEFAEPARPDVDATPVGGRDPRLAMLAPLTEARLLTADEEQSLFRRMNYLKYRAARLRDQGKRRGASPELVERIEALLTAAVAIRNRIIAANLRLVVSVAKKFVDPTHTLADLISDGNLSLMRAVENFDFARGFRFSTYATWAMRYNFARKLAGDRNRQKRVGLADDDLLEQVADRERPDELSDAELGRVKSTIGAALAQLDRRERTILKLRFGFGQHRDEQTLQAIARELGVCKERVRQLQIRAMEKLRGILAAEPLELPGLEA